VSPQQHLHAQPPPSARGGANVGLWIGGAVVASVLVAVVAYLIARPGASTTRDADADPIEVPREVASPVDADVWALGRVDCEATCQQVSSCGFTTLPCRMLCSSQDWMRRCLANTECQAFSTCLLSTGCSGGPSGSASCAEAAACGIECLQNRAGTECGCNCMQQLDPRHTLTLARLSYCVIANCQGQDLETCVAANCAAEAASCAGTEGTP
jgi:hypothetical protein